MTIQFQDYQPVNSDSDDKTLYGDIIRHCKDWKHYADSSRYTTAHECTHGINNDLRLASGDWEGKNGFYLGQNRSIILDEPKIKKSDIIPFIPQELRSARFNLYVQGQQSWNDKPLYIFDEGVAYINDAWAAIELKEVENYVEKFTVTAYAQWSPSPPTTIAQRHYPRPFPVVGKEDTAGNTIVDGEIEFIPYMSAVLMATAKLAPPLDQRLIDFSRWLFRHASNAYYRSLKDNFPTFDTQDKLWQTLKEGSSASDMRNFLRDVVGYTCPDWEVSEDDDPWYA